MAKQMKYGRYLHGGDYNPEQWLDRPDILQKDIEYFKKAHINTVSVGIFSWAVLEPEEGKYNFDWLEEIINNLYKEGIYTILATPSGSKTKMDGRQVRRSTSYGSGQNKKILRWQTESLLYLSGIQRKSPCDR